eukprot:CAMPEP_0201578284 /NCGR_PEP_ID=MMETSP0190_2-20130828/25088_1 /ASSEMBLY_ACC=CAM_ASM_000263 /TAXON_ID=37353 /ORGANISM="Rosalina sp." /LENGTH=82 /DNA_ID=CAMNT_0048011289 /DNA_START=294 /DNA_END=539 /DNA_ORIENTATION=+
MSNMNKVDTIDSKDIMSTLPNTPDLNARNQSRPEGGIDDGIDDLDLEEHPVNEFEEIGLMDGHGIITMPDHNDNYNNNNEEK